MTKVPDQEWVSLMATNAAALAAENTLQLWRAGLLKDETLPHLQERLREIAKLFEAIGNEKSAQQFWTAANLLPKTPSGHRS